MLRWVVALVGAGVLAVGLWAFEPWRLVTSSEVDEPLPTVAGASPVAGPPADPVVGSPGDSPAPSYGAGAAPSAPAAPVAEPGPVEPVAGPFEDAEHGTTGRARVIELADGSRFLRLEDLDTSDGPDLHVWLSDAPSGGSWGSYDDGRYLRLGELTATRGNQNYEIPADADLRGLTTAVIWCDRFNVAFGTAPLT